MRRAVEPCYYYYYTGAAWISMPNSVSNCDQSDMLLALAGVAAVWVAGSGLVPESGDNSLDARHSRHTKKGTERYLSVQLCGGLTNQRLALLDALLIAHATDRRLILPRMLLNGTQDARHSYQMDHADGTVPFRKFFDVNTTRRNLLPHVEVFEEEPAGKPDQQISVYGKRHTLDYYKSSLADAAWVQMDCTYAAVDPHDRAEKRDFYWRLEAALVPSQHISGAAELIKKLLKARSLAAGADGSFTALHLRIEPDWVEHCKLWQSTQPPEGRNCMTNSLLLDRVFLIERVAQSRPVFVAAELTREELIAHPGVQRLTKHFSVTSKRGLSGLQTVKDSETHVTLRARSQAVAQLRLALHGASREIAAAVDLEVCKAADQFVGNSVSTFSAWELMRRGWICGGSCKAHKYNSFHYNGGTVPLAADIFNGGSTLQPRPLKWVFSTSAYSSPAYLMMARVAVDSALNNTNLMPVLLFDGESDHDIAIWMTQRGVPVICHKPDWLPLLRKSFEAASTDKKQLGSTSPLYGSVEKMAATWMRIDIPQLGFVDEFVLYADIDIMFVNDVTVSQFAADLDGNGLPGDGNDLHYIVGTETSMLQPTECCSETSKRFGQTIDYGNAGVMLLHVARMRATNAEFVAWIFTDENIYEKELHFGVYGPQDQGAYNAFYQDRFEVRTAPLFNWKPYWGYNADASLIHFHGPKPEEYLAYAGRACHPEAVRPIEAIVGLMDTCQNMNNGCMQYIKPWLDFANASTNSAAWTNKLDNVVNSSHCSENQQAAAAPPPPAGEGTFDYGQPAVDTPPDEGQQMSMHLIKNCESCGVDWCKKAEWGECVTFGLNDGTHILGPTIAKIGCDVLTSRTPYCIAGSSEIYGGVVTTAASSKENDFDSTSCVSRSPDADTAWCMASCTTAGCPSSSGLCECGRTGTKGRTRMPRQREADDGQWHPRHLSQHRRAATEQLYSLKP